MSTLRRSICSGRWAFLLCVLAARLSGQSAAPQEAPCFRIHLHLNGKPIEGPQAITLETKQRDITVPLEGSCFTLPHAMRGQGKIDISFTIPGNKVHLSAIDEGFFSGSWDIDLEDKRFSNEVVLPKHARVKKACAVIFHVGEPETSMSQAGCRTPVR